MAVTPAQQLHASFLRSVISRTICRSVKETLEDMAEVLPPEIYASGQTLKELVYCAAG